MIIATNFTAEGEATAHVLAEALKARGLKVTRLARGVPIGSELEYVDLGTIAHALVRPALSGARRRYLRATLRVDLRAGRGCAASSSALADRVDVADFVAFAAGARCAT